MGPTSTRSQVQIMKLFIRFHKSTVNLTKYQILMASPTRSGSQKARNGLMRKKWNEKSASKRADHVDRQVNWYSGRLLDRIFPAFLLLLDTNLKAVILCNMNKNLRLKLQKIAILAFFTLKPILEPADLFSKIGLGHIKSIFMG